MALAAAAARLVLAAVFGVAALAKIADRPGTLRSLREFGVGQRLAGPVAVLLPLAELAVAAGLLVGASARVAAAGALVLLAAFTAAAGLAMRRGRSPDCHCFGQLGSEPVGRETLVRNGLLAALAVVVLATPAGTLLEPAPIVVAAVLLAGGLSRSRKRVATGSGRLLESPPVSSPAPDLALTSLAGASVALSGVVDPGRPVVLVRVSPDCGSCGPLLREVGRWQQALSHDLDVVAISTGDLRRSRRLAKEQGVERLFVAGADQFEEAYGMRPTPSALLIDERSRIAGAPVAGGPAVESLIRLALRRDAA